MPHTRLFVYLRLAPEHHDRLLVETLLPVQQALAASGAPHALWFTRSDVPEWLLRVTVRGAHDWLARDVRPLLLTSWSAQPRLELLDQTALPEYAAERARWASDAGADLAERCFHDDTRACLAWLALEARGAAGVSRREYSLLMTEALLEAFAVTAVERREFYRLGQAWPLERGIWSDAEVTLLEQRYQTLRASLAERLCARRENPLVTWGNAASAAIAARATADWLDASDAWQRARAAGLLPPEWPRVLWSLAHLHALRLGLTGVAEASLRFFVHRLLQDGDLS